MSAHYLEYFGTDRKLGSGTVPPARRRKALDCRREFGYTHGEVDPWWEERQYSRQLYHFLNIDEENKVGGKHTVLFKSFLSLLGEPTWSQSPAEIHRICTSLKTNISLGTKALLSSRFVCEILTHQEMAPSWVSTHKNMNAKDKPAQPIWPLPHS